VADSEVGTPGDQHAEGVGSDERGQYRSLPQPSMAEANRELFQESRRQAASRLAAATLVRAYCLTGCMLVLMLVLSFYTVLVYAWGYKVYLTEKDKPCDQPLSRWLIVTFVVFPVRFMLDVIRRCLYWTFSEESIPRCFSAVMMAWQILGNPLLLCLGFWWLLHCNTCQKTNPILHKFVQLFYVYQVIVWIGSLFIICVLNSLLLWIQHTGLLDSGPGQHAAAGPGVINKIETVTFSPNLFGTGPGDDRQPAECCVCHGFFDAVQPIKRTPCGHFFHEECLGTWLGKFAKSCPLCRTNLEDAVGQEAV